MRICVFLGASAGMSPVYAEAARTLGLLMAERGIGLVYGGGQVGLMGIIADAVLEAGGEAIGIIPDSLRAREGDHPNLKQLLVVQTMHQRKAKMAELADGYITLPGGIGTLEEMFETWTWAQLGIHAKPCGLLNINGFYERLSGFIDHVVDEGFLQARHRHMLMIEREPALLLDRMAEYLAPETEKFLGAESL